MFHDESGSAGSYHDRSFAAFALIFNGILGRCLDPPEDYNAGSISFQARSSDCRYRDSAQGSHDSEFEITRNEEMSDMFTTKRGHATTWWYVFCDCVQLGVRE